MEKGPKKPKPLLSELSEKAQQPAAKQAPTIPDIRAIEIPFRSRSQETRQGSRQTTDTGSGPQRSEVRPGLSQGNMSDRPMTFDYKHGLTTGDRYQEMGEREEPVKSGTYIKLSTLGKISANNILKYFSQKIGFDISCKLSLVAELNAHRTCDQEVVGSIPAVDSILSWRFDQNKIIFCGHSLPSADSRRAFSVSSERMCTILANCLTKPAQ